MIRAKVTKPKDQRTSADEVPFDLKTDRYLEYDAANPSASIPDLVRGLKDTKVSDRTDSPVFRSLPRLEEPDHSKLSPVPLGFANDVESADLQITGGKARASGQGGKTISLGVGWPPRCWPESVQMQVHELRPRVVGGD